jgi:DNA-binding MarR family transcriptional regulator
MKKTNEMVMDHLNRIINQVLLLKKRSFFQFEDVEFYPSEVHLLLVIKEKSATNATKMAGELGITKGAVSQTLSRLEKKGVLTKTKDPYKKNELTIIFTSFGAAAFKYYTTRLTKLHKKHNRYLDSFSDKEKVVVERFLTEVEKMIDDIA